MGSSELLPFSRGSTWGNHQQSTLSRAALLNRKSLLLHRRIRNSELLQISLVTSRVVVGLLQFGQEFVHFLSIELDRRLVVWPNQRRVLEFLGLHVAEVRSCLLYQYRSCEEVERGHCLHLRSCTRALVSDRSSHGDCI